MYGRSGSCHRASSTSAVKESSLVHCASRGPSRTEERVEHLLRTNTDATVATSVATGARDEVPCRVAPSNE
jgi:hypothetical protein